MKLHGLIRLALPAALAGALEWLALHCEIIQPAALEWQLGRFGRWAPMLFVFTLCVGHGAVRTWISSHYGPAALCSVRPGEPYRRGGCSHADKLANKNFERASVRPPE